MADGIKKIGRNKWQVRVSRIDEKTGQKLDVKRLIDGTREAAERAREALLAEFRAGGSRQRQRLADYARSWLDARRRTLKPSVAKKYATSLDLHILPALGQFFVDALEPGEVQRYVTDRLDAGAAANTVNNELRLMRTMARDSVADGAATRNWTERVKAAPVAGYTDEDPNLLTAQQLAALLASIPRQWSAIVHLLATTGLRWGEASALCWADVALEREPVPWPPDRRPWDVVGHLKVKRSNWRGEAVAPKTTRSHRSVPLLREVADLLGAPGAPGAWLFPTASGDLHRGYPLRDVLDRAAIAAGLAHRRPGGGIGGTRITPHGLRRTWNNLARQRGDRQVVQAITGHTTDAMTEHYSKIGADEKGALASSVRAALAPPAPPQQTPTGTMALVDEGGVVWALKDREWCRLGKLVPQDDGS
jgi:integrase